LKQTIHNATAVLWLQIMVYVVLFSTINVLYVYITISEACAQRPVWLFTVFPGCHASKICCSDIFWMILRWFQLPLLWLVSLCLYITHTIIIIIIITIIILLLSTFLTPQQFSWFSNECGSHWPSNSSSLFCHPQGSWTLRMWLIGCPETSVRNYNCSLRNNPEERSSQYISCLLTLSVRIHNH
jgi:hypothetical protein